jgi:hypothetical protein
VFQSSLRPSLPPILGTVRRASCESLHPVRELHRPRLSQVSCTSRRNATLMHFTCYYYFKHRCQPSVHRRPPVPIAREPPPLPRGRLTYYYLSPPTTDRQTDTTSDQQRLGTPPSRRPGVGSSRPSLPPLSCFSYPANQATSAASRFVSWKMGRHTRARWRLDRGRMNNT